MMKRSDFAAVSLGIGTVVFLVLVTSWYYQSYYSLLQQQMESGVRSEQVKSIEDDTKKLLFVFSIKNDANLPLWCEKISSVIDKYGLNGSIFISGKIAERYPMCVTNFSQNNNTTDIGTMTYDYINLASIDDYSQKLNEVYNGKKTIDSIGRLNSTLFKAPYGSTDEDIYSLLERSKIVADFSYNNNYNVYSEGEYIGYDIVAYNGSNDLSRNTFIDGLSSNNITSPMLVEFDNSFPIDDLNKFLTQMVKEHKNIRFLNPSELTGMDLSTRLG